MSDLFLPLLAKEEYIHFKTRNKRRVFKPLAYIYAILTYDRYIREVKEINRRIREIQSEPISVMYDEDIKF